MKIPVSLLSHVVTIADFVAERLLKAADNLRLRAVQRGFSDAVGSIVDRWMGLCRHARMNMNRDW